MIKIHSESKKLGIQIALLVFLISALYTHLALTANDLSRYALAHSLALNGTAEISQSLAIFPGGSHNIDRATYKENTYSDKGPLGGFLGTPIVFISHHLSGGNEVISIFCTSLFIAALPLALITYFMVLLLLDYGFSEQHAAMLSFLFSTGTNLLFWSTLMFSHALSAALIFLPFAIVKLNKFSTKSLFIGGLLAGLSVSSDYVTALFLPPYFFYCLYHTKTKALLFFLGASLAGILPAMYHTILFNNPLSLPYEHLAVLQDQHNVGFMGATIPSIAVIGQNLFGLSHGLFIYNPILLIGLISIPMFYKKNKADSFFWGLSVLFFLLFDASLKQHDSYAYGNTWGPRYLMPIAAPLFVFSAGAIDSLLTKKVALVIGVFSTLFNFYIINLAFIPNAFTALSALVDVGPHLFSITGGTNIYTQAVLANRNIVTEAGSLNALDALFRNLPEIANNPQLLGLMHFSDYIFKVPLFPSLAISILSIAIPAFFVWKIIKSLR